jgi:hypothetical protein
VHYYYYIQKRKENNNNKNISAFGAVDRLPFISEYVGPLPERESRLSNR